MSNICIEYLLPWCDDVIVMPLLKHFEIQRARVKLKKHRITQILSPGYLTAFTASHIYDISYNIPFSPHKNETRSQLDGEEHLCSGIWHLDSDAGDGDGDGETKNSTCFLKTLDGSFSKSGSMIRNGSNRL